jgi:hypothetical protein
MATSMIRPRAGDAEGRGRYVRNIPQQAPQQMSNRMQPTGTVAQQPPAGNQFNIQGVEMDEDGFPVAYNKDSASSPAPTSYSGYNRYTGTNLNDMISNDRDFAFGRGDELFQNAKDRGANESQVKENYRRYGDEVYDPLIGGRGGYSADEASGIMREGEFGQFMTDDGGYDANFLTPDEAGAMAGRPWDRAAYFNPEAMDARQNESADRQRYAVDDMATGLYESLDGNLGMSDEYSQGVDRTLADAEGRTRGAYDPAALRADSASLNRIRMTPEEEQDIVERAGISGGMKYRSAAGELDRKARAAGGDPVAAAAMRGRYLRDAAGDSADAMTSARVMASNARAGREGTAEGMRMTGERTAADIGTGVELSLADRRLNAGTTKEGMRLSSERDIANRRQGIARDIGQTRLNAEQGINSQQRQQSQYNTSMGTDIATGVERDSADRAAQIAANRQTQNRANQTQRFGQGMTRNDAMSGRTTQVAGARRQDAQEGRGWIRDQAGMSNSNAQREYDRQGSIYATQGQLAQGTTAAQQRKDQQPKWWEKLIGAGAQAAGAFMGGG